MFKWFLNYIPVGCLWMFTIYKRCPEILNVAGSTEFIRLKAPLKYMLHLIKRMQRLLEDNTKNFVTTW